MRTIYHYTPEHIPADFYKKMFGIKSICKEMQSNTLYCTDCDLWVCIADDMNLIAFSGVKFKSNGMWLEHDYVYPEYMGNGLHKLMIRYRLEHFPHNTAFASCVEASRKNYLDAGFKRMANKNGFIVMRNI